MTGKATRGDYVTVFLAGDVMTGRGIDQILPHPNVPEIQESYVRDARDYVELAERVNGPIVRPVDCRYIWGDALAELDRVSPHARIINLETSVTSSDTYWASDSLERRLSAFENEYRRLQSECHPRRRCRPRSGRQPFCDHWCN
jgi:poly-gamma-glutamate capsule biosynthesis protein CapA/YwtB (metallophosphatase superfamily)